MIKMTNANLGWLRLGYFSDPIMASKHVIGQGMLVYTYMDSSLYYSRFS